ncbi:hypothetical protein [Nocardioides bruguierae]|nr:hypothetical protein [Nocardioides bruguierae]
MAELEAGLVSELEEDSAALVSQWMSMLYAFWPAVAASMQPSSAEA